MLINRHTLTKEVSIDKLGVVHSLEQNGGSEFVGTTDARKHVHRLGGTLRSDWMAAAFHVALFRVGRDLHIWLVTRKDPVLKVI